jgi:hypothetical protein
LCLKKIVLRRIFGPRKWRDARADCKLKSFIASNTSPNIIRLIKSRRIRWDGHPVRTGEIVYAYNILVGKGERKRPLGRPRHRW